MLYPRLKELRVYDCQPELSDCDADTNILARRQDDNDNLMKDFIIDDGDDDHQVIAL